MDAHWNTMHFFKWMIYLFLCFPVSNVDWCYNNMAKTSAAVEKKFVLSPVGGVEAGITVYY